MRDNTTKTIHKQDIIDQLNEGGIYDNNGNNFGPEYWNQENAINQETILDSWKQRTIYYSTNNFDGKRIGEDDVYDLYRNVNYYYKEGNTKTYIHLGCTLESFNNFIFGEYEKESNIDSLDSKSMVNGTNNGGFYWRNKFILYLVNNGYNIIQLPQLSHLENKILMKDSVEGESGFIPEPENTRKPKFKYADHIDSPQKIIPDNLDWDTKYEFLEKDINEKSKPCYHNWGDRYSFWFCYNDQSGAITYNSAAERYNYDICGKRKENSPDKDFLQKFFKDTEINNKFKNTNLYMGGYSGGGYMCHRIIHETLKKNLTWLNGDSINFHKCYTLCGVLPWAISPWTIELQCITRSILDSKQTNNWKNIYGDTINNISGYAEYMKSIYIDKDMLSLNEFKKYPPILIISPENDDVVDKITNRYTYDLLKDKLNKSNRRKNNIIIPLEDNENANDSIFSRNIQHNWYGPCSTLIGNDSKRYTNSNKKYKMEKSKGSIDDIFSFFEEDNDIYLNEELFLNDQFIGNICFVKDTLVKTDQGNIKIQEINKDINTIENESIVAITQTYSDGKYIIKVEKDAIGKDIPNKDVILSGYHKIMYNGKLIMAIDLLNILPNKVMCIENKKDKLYNVLMNKYTTIMVNNMEVETLDPNNPVAKLYN